MKLFSNTFSRRSFATLVIAAVTFAPSFVTLRATPIESEQVSDPAKPARMNCGAKIECITPDGREGVVATRTDQIRSAAALIMDDDTLSCPLKEGQTTFIITLPTDSLVGQFTFLNENAAARGELKIAVSNDELPASSNEWVEVDGRIPFTNKRLFNVSMVGVDARYLKVSFQVENGEQVASRDAFGGEPLHRFAER